MYFKATTFLLLFWGLSIVDAPAQGHLFFLGKTAGPDPVEAALVFSGMLSLAYFFFRRREQSENINWKRKYVEKTRALESSKILLAEKKELLERTQSELTSFTYIASHDLKSPLRNIISFVSLIERKLKDQPDPELKEYLRHTSDNARQMYSLIQNVLEFSNMGQPKTRKKKVNMNDTLWMAVKNLRPQIEAKNASVQAELLPGVQADAAEVTQLFQNLVSNGILFNQSASPKVNISHRSENGHDVISVRDNGIGISPEYHDKVFEMFSRLHSIEKYPGTGVGLALCQKIVKNFGGKIWLDSTQGAGTTVHFSIPRCH